MRVGIDVIEHARFEKIKSAHLEKIFTPKELEYATSVNIPMRLAGIYACKEAFVKALGVGIAPIGLNNIEVGHLPSGKPVLILSDKIKQTYNIANLDVSISHTDTLATAICVIAD